MVDPTQIFSLLTSVIEFSKKSEEIVEGFNELRLTCESISRVVSNGSIINSLGADLLANITTDLNEALKLIQSVKIPDTITKKLLSSLKSLLPGNKLEQIKELNLKLLRYMQQINMIMNIMKIEKSEGGSSPVHKKLKESNNFGPTLPDDLGPTLNNDLGPTIEENKSNMKDQIIYEIVYQGEQDLVNRFLMSAEMNITETLKMPEIEKLKENEKKEVFSLGRKKFLRLEKPPFGKEEDLRIFNALSREHIVIIVQKKETSLLSPKINLLKNKVAPVLEDIFFTCPSEEFAAASESKSKTTEIEKNENKEENKDKQKNYEYSFLVVDKSLNGTYIERKGKKEGGWVKINKNEETLLEIGDTVGLVMEKGNHLIKKNLSLGFYINKKIY